MDKECGRQGRPRKFLPCRKSILRKRLLQGLGCTERTSRLLSCGEWCCIAVFAYACEKMQKARPFRRPGYAERAFRLLFCGEEWLAGCEPGYTERAFRLLFCGEEWLAGCEQGTGKKFLPRRTRIPLQAASSGAWLHRTRAPASFQWRGVLYSVCSTRAQKPIREAGDRQKILPRRNRIWGKWLFRRLTVGNTIKTLGFRNMLWESGPWKNFLKVLCPLRNLRESGSFGKVSYYKVWP